MPASNPPNAARYTQDLYCRTRHKHEHKPPPPRSPSVPAPVNRLPRLESDLCNTAPLTLRSSSWPFLPWPSPLLRARLQKPDQLLTQVSAGCLTRLRVKQRAVEDDCERLGLTRCGGGGPRRLGKKSRRQEKNLASSPGSTESLRWAGGDPKAWTTVCWACWFAAQEPVQRRKTLRGPGKGDGHIRGDAGMGTGAAQRSWYAGGGGGGGRRGGGGEKHCWQHPSDNCTGGRSANSREPGPQSRNLGLDFGSGGTTGLELWWHWHMQGFFFEVEKKKAEESSMRSGGGAKGVRSGRLRSALPEIQPSRAFGYVHQRCSWADSPPSFLGQSLSQSEGEGGASYKAAQHNSLAHIPLRQRQL